MPTGLVGTVSLLVLGWSLVSHEISRLIVFERLKVKKSKSHLLQFRVALKG